MKTFQPFNIDQFANICSEFILQSITLRDYWHPGVFWIFQRLLNAILSLRKVLQISDNLIVVASDRNYGENKNE